MKTAEEYYQDIEPLIGNGWYQAAICAFEQLLETNPEFGHGHHELGTLHYKYGYRDKVLECYKRAVSIDPENIQYLKSLADFYHAGLEQGEAALGVYEKIIELDGSDVESLFIAANLKVVLHDFDNAMNYYQKVLDIEPWHAEASNYLEKIRKHLDSKSKALSPEELYQKSQEAEASEDAESAISLLEQLVAKNPDDAIAHNDLGVYYQKMGNDEMALDHYAYALRLEPYNSTFEKNLADFNFVVKGEVGEALKHYLNVLKRNPEDTEVLMAAGHVCRVLNKPEDAGLFFRRVLEIEPWSLEASENLEKLREDPAGKTAAGF